MISQFALTGAQKKRLQTLNLNSDCLQGGSALSVVVEWMAHLNTGINSDCRIQGTPPAAMPPAPGDL